MTAPAPATTETARPVVVYWHCPRDRCRMSAHVDRVADCPFCGRVERREYLDTAAPAVARFEPLNPVTAGHMLFLPKRHIKDAADHPGVAGITVDAAAVWAKMQRRAGLVDDFNIITSAGSAATQSVWHLHIHYVPRRAGDGLHLPWTGQSR